MALGKRALDVLKRTPEVEKTLEYCGEGGGLTDEIHRFVISLEGPLRSQLGLDQWSQKKVEKEKASFIWLNLFPAAWRLPGDEYVAFGVAWCNPFDEEADDPYVFIRAPPANVFPQRDRLLRQVRPALIKVGFEDQIPGDDPYPYFPLWKYLRFDSFQSASGFDSDALVKAVIETFRSLLPAAAMVDQFFKSLPAGTPPPPATERTPKVIAFVDTETSGTGAAAKMTELAIIDAAFDEACDQVVGVLEEYSSKSPKTLDETKAHSVLDRAEVIVAHNAEFDRGVLGRALPGTEKRRWLDSCHGIDWKHLNGVQSESLETLLGAEGLRQGQDHHAREDAHDLLRLMAVQRDGVTYLKRLLSKPRSATVSK